MLGASNEQVKVLGLGSDEIFEFSCCFHCWFFSWKSNAGHWRIWQNASLQHWGLPAIAGLHSYIYIYIAIDTSNRWPSYPTYLSLGGSAPSRYVAETRYVWTDHVGPNEPLPVLGYPLDICYIAKPWHICRWFWVIYRWIWWFSMFFSCSQIFE